MAEALDVGVVFGLDHDAGELLGAGVAEDDAAVFTECGLGFGEGTGDGGERLERGLGFYFYVDDGLWIVLEALDEGFDLAAHGDERSDFDSGEQAVSRRAVVEENDVAGLFAADDVATLEHFLEDVAIADGGAGERDTFAGEHALETEIRHGSGDDAVALEFALGLEITRDGKEDAVAVDDFPRFASEEGAIGIAIEGNAEPGAFRDNPFLQAFEMERAAAGIDVAAIG